MQALGVEVDVIAPQNWDEQGKGQVNDKHDAQVMSRGLSEYLCGHSKGLSIVRIPSREEEAARGAGTDVRSTTRRVAADAGDGTQSVIAAENRGKWTVVERDELDANKERGPGVGARLLERWKKLIEGIAEQAEEIEAELRAEAPLPELLFGEGELTHQLLARELIDPQRFRNARQVGNSFGLCPSESSSAERRRLGSITKHGHPRLRRLMVELAWRISRFQPRYRAVRRWAAVLEDPKACAAARKRAIGERASVRLEEKALRK